MFFDTSFSAFVTLVDYFPNLTALRLDSFYVGCDDRPVQPLSRPLRGRIHLGYANPNHLGFFDRLATLDSEYEELVVESEFRLGTKDVESILQLGTSTVKYLRLTAELEREHPYKTSSSLYILT